MTDFALDLAGLAAAAASLITIVSLASLLLKGLVYLADSPRKLKSSLARKPRHILLPTPDELAKYCVKNDPSRDLSEDERYEIYKGLVSRYYRDTRRVREQRAAVLSLACAIIFGVFLVKLIYLGFKDESPSVVDPLATAYTSMVTWMLAMCALAIWLEKGYRAATRSRRERTGLQVLKTEFRRYFNKL